jgi:Mor family transcriptional regulator
VVEIRERHHVGASLRELAERYDVTRNIIRNVVLGRTWKKKE